MFKNNNIIILLLQLFVEENRYTILSRTCRNVPDFTIQAPNGDIISLESVDELLKSLLPQADFGSGVRPTIKAKQKKSKEESSTKDPIHSQISQSSSKTKVKSVTKRYNIIMILCLKTIILLSYCYSCLLKKIGILNFLLQNQRAGYLNKAKSNLDFVSQQSLFLHCELYRSGQVLLFFDIVTLTLFWTVLICVHCMSGSAKMEVTCNVIWSSCC